HRMIVFKREKVLIIQRFIYRKVVGFITVTDPLLSDVDPLSRGLIDRFRNGLRGQHLPSIARDLSVGGTRYTPLRAANFYLPNERAATVVMICHPDLE